MDYETARANMIEQQIRPWNVLEMQTLDALGALRREDFVPPEHRDLAFADVQIPLPDGEVMLEPKLSARMMEALHLQVTDKVLEIGTGSGYLTALLALVSKHVTSVEINPTLLQLGQRNLGMAGIDNAAVVEGDGHAGWGEAGEYDAILIGGSLPIVSSIWFDKLKPGGRLMVIEGHEPAMQAVRYIKSGSSVKRESLFETWAPRLKNAEETPEFEF
ncbi:MAG: protein-L-isoaspartate O-methyltransferase [Acidiferrobacterales bacterium]|nr:protein-L-isoaspartate O-methyltransferase [Acidiferrobacterales bacterium]